MPIQVQIRPQPQPAQRRARRNPAPRIQLAAPTPAAARIPAPAMLTRTPRLHLQPLDQAAAQRARKAAPPALKAKARLARPAILRVTVPAAAVPGKTPSRDALRVQARVASSFATRRTAM